MTIIKDSNYWKEYNQKRREYLTQKERERRQKLKGVYNQEIKLERVQPKSEKVVDIQTFSAEVYKRAGTKEEARFYTFLDGKKIVRTKCGCNPNNQGFYDWCLDNCQYFITWRNNQISNDK